MGEASSIIVFSSYCRGIRFFIFQTTSRKSDSFPFYSPCCSLAFCHRHAEPFSKKCSNCSVIQSVWLYNILVLVHYHKKEYFHTKTGQCFEGQGHYDSKMEHFCQCSISESLQWLGFLLHIQKINGERKPNFDIWVQGSKVNFPATLWLHFLSDRISLLL